MNRRSTVKRVLSGFLWLFVGLFVYMGILSSIMSFYTSMPASNPAEIEELRKSIESGEKLTEVLSPYIFWGGEAIIVVLCILGRLPGTSRYFEAQESPIPKPKNTSNPQAQDRKVVGLSLKVSALFWLVSLSYIALNWFVFNILGIELNLGSGFLYVLSKSLLVIILLALLVLSVIASLTEQKENNSRSSVSLAVAVLNVLCSPFILLA